MASESLSAERCGYSGVSAWTAPIEVAEVAEAVNSASGNQLQTHIAKLGALDLLVLPTSMEAYIAVVGLRRTNNLNEIQPY